MTGQWLTCWTRSCRKQARGGGRNARARPALSPVLVQLGCRSAHLLEEIQRQRGHREEGNDEEIDRVEAGQGPEALGVLKVLHPARTDGGGLLEWLLTQTRYR